ncbi:hypothetical protein T06_8428 [Trichinella sp. T6]|nr:hypothetical protein T06_8428 [Trichinella sp. T6]
MQKDAGIVNNLGLELEFETYFSRDICFRCVEKTRLPKRRNAQMEILANMCFFLKDDFIGS